MLLLRGVSAASVLALAAVLVAGTGTDAHAQFGNLKDKLKARGQQKVDKATDDAINAADPTAAKNKGKADAATAPAAATETSAAAPDARAATPAGRKVWANYDFVPGARTLFFTDFTDEAVGNFPRRLTFKSGAMEIVEVDGQRALKASTASQLLIPLPEVLPAKFTIEIDVINRNSMGTAASTFDLRGGAELTTNPEWTTVSFGHNGWEVSSTESKAEAMASDADRTRYLGKPASIRILGDGNYLKLYADERRLASVPNANFRRANVLYLLLNARDGEESAVYVTRIRVAESQKSVYDALATSGRWATQGILFETGKADLKPESTPTLKEIASALTQHADLKVEIQGHTDNVGRPADNLKLSEARAAAVRDALVSEYGVDAARLTTKGYGDRKPLGPNTTAEGKANNRRVELVKL